MKQNRGFLPGVVEFGVTGFYTGYLPFAPGTWGSLAAMLFAVNIYAVSSELTLEWLRFFAVVTTMFGIVFSGAWAKMIEVKDPPSVVIDEWAGLFLAYSFSEPTIVTLIAGFFLFRIFDITKPWPANSLQSLPGGWGIMLDDLVAGFYAAAILAIFEFIYAG